MWKSNEFRFILHGKYITYIITLKSDLSFLQPGTESKYYKATKRKHSEKQSKSSRKISMLNSLVIIMAVENKMQCC